MHGRGHGRYEETKTGEARLRKHVGGVRCSTDSAVDSEYANQRNFAVVVLVCACLISFRLSFSFSSLTYIYMYMYICILVQYYVRTVLLYFVFLFSGVGVGLRCMMYVHTLCSTSYRRAVLSIVHM